MNLILEKPGAEKIISHQLFSALSPQGCHALGTRSCADPGFQFLSLCPLFALLDKHFLCLVPRRLPKMEGSIISSTRILITAAFGPVLIAGEVLSLGGWLGLH